ncbi:MAG: von Willebrand factor type A domain-containing protein [bacterium]|nr:von Willebrand factor type A domain-containing protein [bacterium]
MPQPGSVTGGTTPPNGEKFELMYFEHAGVNPFVATDDDALSTFALDVDNASFSLARSYLDRGELPPADAIRVEEFVNALDAGWQRHGSETFRIGLDGGPSRFGEGYHLLRVGIVGRSVEDGRRKPANLVFVIDVSGSMDRESRLGSVKRALRTLVDELGEGDRVGIVVYGSRGEVLLPLTDVSQRSTILGVIDGLQPNGSTNAVEGLTLAYDLARRSYDAGIINRLVLCSDGVANTGTATSAEGILALARRGSDDGITLSTVGFGMGNYNDVLMEQARRPGRRQLLLRRRSAGGRARVPREPDRHAADHRHAGEGAGRVRSASRFTLEAAGLRESRRGRPRLPQRRRRCRRGGRRAPGHRAVRAQAGG